MSNSLKTFIGNPFSHKEFAGSIANKEFTLYGYCYLPKKIWMDRKEVEIEKMVRVKLGEIVVLIDEVLNMSFADISHSGYNSKCSLCLWNNQLYVFANEELEDFKINE